MATLPKGQGILLPPFKSWLASNIPAVYDNTMTYYEELCALIKYLQDIVVPAVNENASAVTTISNAVEQLQKYVDDYFKNLDVQEEINNKLDEMAEDGTLQEIMADYIQLLATWTYDTVADMQASEQLINGSYAQTLGYHSINDGGGGLYKITNTGTADGGETIAVGLLFAHLVKTTPNVKQYGAYGDDTHDDSSAIQLAIDSNTDGELDFVEGTYLCNSTIEISENIKIKGYNAKIHSTADTGVLVGNETKVMKVYIDDLAVERSEYDDTTDNYGFRFIRCYESVFTNLYAKEFVYNFYLNPQTAGFGYNVFNNISGVNGKINLLISANRDGGGWVNQNIFYGGRFVTSENTLYNIKVENGDSNSFYTPCCEGSATNSILLDGTHCIVEYPRTEGTWSDSGYAIRLGTNSDANRIVGLRYDLDLIDTGKNNSWWTQYDGLHVNTDRINGNGATIRRTGNSSSSNHVPILSVEDQGTSGSTTLIKVVEKDTSANHRVFKVETKSGEERAYMNGYGNWYCKHAIGVITPVGHILPIQIGSSGLYYQNNILWSTYAGDKSDAVPVGHDYATYAGDPNNHVTPTYIGQECLDTTNNAWYKATSLTNSSWAKLTA